MKGLLHITSSNHIEFRKRDEKAIGASPYLAHYARDCGRRVITVVPSNGDDAVTITAFIFECQANQLPFKIKFPVNHVISSDGGDAAVEFGMALSQNEIRSLFDAVAAEVQAERDRINAAERARRFPSSS